MKVLPCVEYETLEPCEVPIKIGGVLRFKLITPPASAGRAYEDAKIRLGALNEDGKITFLAVNGAGPVLLAGCLSEKNGDGTFKPLTEDEIRAMPDWFVDDMVNRAEELRKPPSKNSSSAGQDTST